MDKLNKQELRRLAEAATFGPWESVERTGYDGEHYFLIQTQEERNGWEVAEIRMDVPHDNASFIAAANPAAILSLLDECDGLMAQHSRDSAELRSLCQARDEARGERDQLRDELEQYRKVTAPFANYMAARGTARGLQMSISSGDLCAELTESDWFALGAMAKEGGANG